MKTLLRRTFFLCIVMCAIAGFAAVSGWFPWPNPFAEATVPAYETATVVYVVDGDTVDLLIAGSEERVRLIGIDTPETVNRNAPIQCFGAEASEALTQLLPSGSDVRIVRDVSARDRYGRLLLYLYRPSDQLFINQWMIEQGYASAVSYHPNTTFEQEFASVERRAKNDRVGLWGSCDGPDQPLE